MPKQLNKLQIKAEVLTVLAKLQTNIEAANIDKVLKTLVNQEDKESILDVLIKEITKANEEKVILICFLLLKLCESKTVEETLWGVLKNRSVSDSIKAIILNVLKDMGNKVEYDNLEEYFENPTEVIDADTKKLLQAAIINPEAQIDFLDFLNSLSENDKKILIESLGEDYSSDSLANIINPIVLHDPSSELGQICINILGITKSQLALHNLVEALKFVQDKQTEALIKKNISQLKISGIREDKSVEFYKEILISRPYSSYTSYPDGHGNQAIIFSRERADETIQMVAVVINDFYGLLDCFGFNEISKDEFERIVNKFYSKDERIFIDHSVVKKLLFEAEQLTLRNDDKVPYEYICWKTLLLDIEQEPLPFEKILETKYSKSPLTKKDIKEIFMMDVVQKWFFDTDFSSAFKQMVFEMDSKFLKNDFSVDFEKSVQQNVSNIFTMNQVRSLNSRILLCAYLKYLSKKDHDANLLFSLYFDEEKKAELMFNIVRKSVYEYYVSLKFKQKEENKMTNIFSLKNKKTVELTPKQINLIIEIIESLWVDEDE